MGLLSDILASKRAAIPRLRSELHSVSQRSDGPRTAPRAVSLKRRTGEPLRLIAELKFRSPSAGPLSTVQSVEQRACSYARAGAAMMSVLCDSEFFDGDYRHLQRARSASSLPLLCKEFVIDEVQLALAAAYGADWVLLIVRCLEPSQLKALIACCADLALTPLIEVHSHQESQVALDAGATVIGVNARDLDTLQMHPNQAAEVLAALPPEVTALHLSGIKTPMDVAKLAKTSASGALIGEVLMRQDDPEPLLASMVARAVG